MPQHTDVCALVTRSTQVIDPHAPGLHRLLYRVICQYCMFLEIEIQALPAAIESVWENKKIPVVIDPSGRSDVFFRYGHTSVIDLKSVVVKSIGYKPPPPPRPTRARGKPKAKATRSVRSQRKRMMGSGKSTGSESRDTKVRNKQPKRMSSRTGRGAVGGRAPRKREQKQRATKAKTQTKTRLRAHRSTPDEIKASKKKTPNKTNAEGGTQAELTTHAAKAPESAVAAATTPPAEAPPAMANGSMTVRWNHYREEFKMQGGALEMAVVDDRFALSGVYTHYSIHLHKTKKIKERQMLPERNKRFEGLQDGAVYWLEIREDQDYLEEQRMLRSLRQSGVLGQTENGGQSAENSSKSNAKMKDAATREELLEQMRQRLVGSMKYGSTLVLCLHDAAPDLMQIFNHPKYFPTEKVFSVDEMRKKKNWASVVRDKDMMVQGASKNVRWFAVHKDFNVVVTMQHEENDRGRAVQHCLPWHRCEVIQVRQEDPCQALPESDDERDGDRMNCLPDFCKIYERDLEYKGAW